MKRQKVLLIIISTISFLIFAFLLFLVMTKSHWLLVRDEGTALKMSTRRSTAYNIIFVIISYLGETPTIAIFLALLFVLPNKKSVALPVLIITAQSLILCFVTKQIVARERPIGWFLQESVLGYNFPSGYSFPSGHAQTACVFYLSTAILMATNAIKNRVIGDLLVANATIFCFLICFARVYLCVHFLSDVLAGICLCIAIVGTDVLLYQRHTKNDKSRDLNKY